MVSLWKIVTLIVILCVFSLAKGEEDADGEIKIGGWQEIPLSK